MQILANALPGFRDLRAPVISGYMWLIFVWLLVDPNLSHRPSSPLGGALYDLGGRVGHVGIVIGVSVVAYIIGTVSQVATNAIGGLLSRAVQLAPQDGFAHEEIEDLRGRYRTELMAAQDFGSLPIDELTDTLAKRYSRARREAERELSLPATLLVGGDPQLFAEVDRLRAEGELRLSVVAPLSALLTLAVIQDSLWWLAGLPVVAVLLVNGALRNRDSRVLIAGAIARDPDKSSSLVRFRKWIAVERDALRAREQTRLPA